MNHCSFQCYLTSQTERKLLSDVKAEGLEIIIDSDTGCEMCDDDSGIDRYDYFVNNLFEDDKMIRGIYYLDGVFNLSSTNVVLLHNSSIYHSLEYRE